MIPHALKLAETWRAKRMATGHLLIALDFDGTIAPIVRRPQEARMLAPARTAIERLLERHDTDVAIVSGRALEDLRERCGMGGVYYAGNHGLQIDGPGVHETRSDALRLIPRVQAIRRELAAALADIPGVFLEDKELTLSVHTRMIDNEAERNRVDGIVRRAFEADPQGLKLTTGKRIIEVRPDTDWHKGEATLFVIDRVARARQSELFSIFIGDDVTDEDAFTSLSGIGAGIIVAGELPAKTAATAWLKSPEEVVLLLQQLGAA